MFHKPNCSQWTRITNILAIPCMILFGQKFPRRPPASLSETSWPFLPSWAWWIRGKLWFASTIDLNPVHWMTHSIPCCPGWHLGAYGSEVPGLRQSLVYTLTRVVTDLSQRGCWAWDNRARSPWDGCVFSPVCAVVIRICVTGMWNFPVGSFERWGRRGAGIEVGPAGECHQS